MSVLGLVLAEGYSLGTSTLMWKLGQMPDDPGVDPEDRPPMKEDIRGAVIVMVLAIGVMALYWYWI